MKRREFLALAASASAIACAETLGDSAGAARDLLNRALELLWERSSQQQVGDALRLITISLDEDPNFGDAHYYRALCNRKLGRLSVVRPSLEAARMYQSEALRDERDPFRLSAPRILDQYLTTVGQKWALVVGINRFQPNVGADPLRFAADDARAFADMLMDPGIGRFPKEQVFQLTDNEATTSAIKAKLNRIATKAKPEDIVLVYFSTHGSSRADDLRQVSYLYTYDTNVTSRDQVFGTALPLVEVSGIVSTRCVAQRTVVVFDTCHSGTAVAQSLSADDFNRLRAGAGRYILSSCGPDERSYEANGHGLFTASLMASLSERRGCIRMKELIENVQHDVNEKAMSLNKSQRPVAAKSEAAAEIILGASSGQKSEGCLA